MVDIPEPDISDVRFIDGFVTSLNHARELSQRRHTHEDNTLTWALAFMGGALLALPSALQALDLHVEWTRRGYLLACTPWALGVISAVFGRFCYQKVEAVESRFHLYKTTLIRRALIDHAPDSEWVRQIMANNSHDLGKQFASISTWFKPATRFFYLTHGLLVGGFVTIWVFIVWRALTR